LSKHYTTKTKTIAYLGGYLAKSPDTYIERAKDAVKILFVIV